MEKERAIELLKQQQSLIEELKPKSPSELVKFLHEGCNSRAFKKWKRDTSVVIRNVFRGGHHGFSEFRNIQYEYTQKISMTTPAGGFVDRYQEGLSEACDLLQSLIEEVESFWPDAETTASGEAGSRTSPSGSNVFIVHGRDEETKNAVADFVKTLGLKPIILHQQANQGRTIIEKFEDHSNDVGFAVVLCTPDDEGKSVEEDKLKPRARQNVILELGFFLAKLSRGRVCVLYGKGVEMPSDYDGVVYIPLEGTWREELRAEIKAAKLL